MAGGYSKWGLTNGVAAALALSGRILEGHMEWAEVFRPWHSRELRGLPGGALANAEVGVEMARGWIRPLLGSRATCGTTVWARPPRRRKAAAGCRRCAPISAGSSAGTTPSGAGTARCTAPASTKAATCSRGRRPAAYAPADPCLAE